MSSHAGPLRVAALSHALFDDQRNINGYTALMTPGAPEPG
jgi:hypothetical protein